MIWSCLWDVTCNWIASEKDTNNQSIYDISISTKWGNFRVYNTANGFTSGDTGYEAGAGSLQNTGSSEYWKAKNIYDFAGNGVEWTQGASSISMRSMRGSECGGGAYAASSLEAADPRMSGEGSRRCSRPVLYVK